ncbi:MAG: amino acid adenylation domain-containing protein (plasmid) [Leptolyngbya sp. BL-A-14]
MNSSSQEQSFKPIAVDFNPFAGGDLLSTAPATESQKEIWASVQMGSGANSAYNESQTLRFTGDLDVQALQSAIAQLVQRHEALRTTFSPDGINLCITASLQLDVPFLDWSGVELSDRECKIEALRHHEVSAPFDLEHGPLFRAQIIQLSGQEYLTILTAHHIICDGWSWAVLMPDLGKFYSALKQGLSPDLDEPEPFSDYAIALESAESSEEAQATLDYWLQQFATIPPVLDLPSDRPRPSIRTFDADREDWELSPELVASLKQLGTQLGCSFMTTILSTFEVFLHRLTGQDDIVVGVPAAGQAATGSYGVVGHCVNLLPLRSQINPDQPFNQYLQARNSAILDAYDHQQFTFGSLVQKLPIPRDPSRIPLISVLFNLDQGLEADKLPFDGLSVEFFSNPRCYENFEIYINATELKGNVTLECQYNTNLFDAATIRRRLVEFDTLLQGLVANPEQAIASLPLLPAAEQQLLWQWNQTALPYPDHQVIHQLIEAQVERVPDEIAVISGTQQLTYRELNQRANQLAHRLRHLGVQPDQLVGLCIDRSFDMMIALLGILKAGGAYVPLDATYPPERLDFMLADSQVTVLLTQQHLLASLPEVVAENSQPNIRPYIVCLDADWETISQYPLENPSNQTEPRNLAYVIYTSGSTGKPKGVALNHRLLVNLLHWQLHQSNLGKGAKTVQFTPVSFDVSFQEIFSTWYAGGTLVLINDDTRKDALEMLNFLDEQAIERLFLPFIALQHLAEVADSNSIVPLSLREVITAGEQLQITRSIANWFSQLPNCTLYNHYGPSESHVVTSFTLMGSPKNWMTLPPIGKPIANSQIYLLNTHLQPVPIGVAGELCILVEDSVRGYLNRPELTAEKFVPNPFDHQSGSRLYRTGDVARYLPNGNIEYLGRMDGQVKVRGFRIELGEVEATLSQHPAVRDAVAVVREDTPGDRRLVAYVVLNSLEDNAADFKVFLKQKLPEYMLPTAFVILERLPLTPSGKVDRRSLPTPDVIRPDLQSSYVEPRTDTEQRVAQIWAEILKWEHIGVHDNFFELGGYSLLGTQVLTRIRKALAVNMPLKVLFEAPTVAELATRIDALYWVSQEAQADQDRNPMLNYEEGEI